MKKRYWAAGLVAGSAAAWAITRRRAPSKRFTLDLPSGGESFGSEQGDVQFIGTATTLIRWGGMTILTDPNFLHRGEQIHIGYGMHSTRITDPAIGFAQLPHIDFVILSHLHEDHFDRLVERRLPRETPILTTASAAMALEKKGFRRCYPLHTWDKVTIRKGSVRATLTAMPGTHGPLLVAAMLPDVMGSMLEFTNEAEGGRYRIYISGDTLAFKGLEQIPRAYPNIDLALLHFGGARVMGILLTMDTAQGIEALRLIDPDLAIPIHYDDYDVFRSPLEDFKEAVNRAGLASKVHYLAPGEFFRFMLKGSRQTVGEQPLV